MRAAARSRQIATGLLMMLLAWYLAQALHQKSLPQKLDLAESRGEGQPTPPRSSGAPHQVATQSPPIVMYQYSEVKQAIDAARPMPPTPAPHPAPPRPRENTPAREATNAAPPAPATHERPPGAPASEIGDSPALVVDFRQIGLDRYAELVEGSGGAFFTLVGRSLGPRISLLDRRIVEEGPTSDLALAHPNLVRGDPQIAARLSAMALPRGASKTVVVMIWARWFDEMVRTAIDAEAATADVKVSDIAQVSAEYITDGSQIFIKLDDMTVRRTHQRVALSRIMRVSP